MFADPTGFYFKECYLYTNKSWEMAPSGVLTYTLASGVMQSAPVVVTSSGLQETQPHDPWARTTGPGVYDKVGYGYFSSPPQKEFALVPTSSGTLLFSSPLKENVFIEYEAGPSGYYILDTIDLNPVRNEASTGFLHCSVAQEPEFIILTSTNSTLDADGYHFTRVLATLLDDNYDTVPNENIVFEATNPALGTLTPLFGTPTTNPSGVSIEMTNTRGQARATYTPTKGNSGAQIIEAYVENYPSVFTYLRIIQSYVIGNPFILASGSYPPIYSSDPSGSKLNSLDYLT